MLPLQVEIVCCAYYHLLAQQIFMLQKVDVTFTFCQHKRRHTVAKVNVNLYLIQQAYIYSIITRIECKDFLILILVRES